jgi:hypothetical protein
MRGPTDDGGKAPRIVNLDTEMRDHVYASMRLSPGKEIVVSLERDPVCTRAQPERFED